MDDINDTTISFNENEPFEVRRTKALEEIKEVLKKYQVQMRAALICDQISIIAKMVVSDALPQKSQSDLDHAD